MSNDALKQAEQNQMKNLEEKYGKKLDEWKQIVKASGLDKHGQLVSMLKEKYNMTHGYANMLVHFVNESHAGAVSDQDTLVTDQFKGKEDLKPWYDALIEKIKMFGPDVELSPKKGYVSLRRKKQFALIQPSNKTRLDVGINLKNVEATGKLEQSGSWNAMCSHRVKVESEHDVNDALVLWLQKAYEQGG